jgi:hypothetical protein
VVVLDEDGPLLDRHAREGAIERIALDDREQAIRTDRPVDRKDPNIGCPRPATPGLGVAGMDEQPTNPGLEAGRVAERRELAPGRDEGALQGILGKVAIAQDPGRDRVQPVAGRVDQGRERIAITVSGSNDEVFHQVSLSDRAGCRRGHPQ